MAVYTPVALLQAIGIPGDLVVNEAAAMVLQINALGGGICCQQDAHPRFARVGLKSRFDPLAIFGFHAPVQGEQAFRFGQALAFQQVMQPLLGGAILGEDDHALH